MSAEQWFDRWEGRVAETAAALDYPATPDLAAQLRAERMGAAVASQRRAAMTRRMSFAVLALVALCAALLIVPPVRAAIVSFLRIGAVQINLIEPTPTPPTMPTPTPRSTMTPQPTITPTVTRPPLGSVLNLAGETTLARARSSIRFSIKLPTHPSDLGPPDAVFLQDLGDQAVMLVWIDPAQPRRVRLALNILGPEAFVEKVKPRIITTTVVNNQPAVWAVGEYLLRSRGGNPELRRLITGTVLIWQDGDITYRLETDLPMDEAVKIAQSLR